jgi:hypothetical protein
MNRNISKHFSQYKTQYEKYNLLMEKVHLDVIEYDDLLREVNPHEVERLRDLCVDEYANVLKAVSDKELVYYEWIKSVTGEDNLYLLEVLLFLKTRVTNVDFTNANLFLLNYFVKYFARSEDEGNTKYAKYLFEWILDVLDNETEECSDILESIFSLGKPPEWFEGFYDQIRKLTLRARVNEKTFSAVKKGLLITTTPDIKEFLEEYLEERMA